MGLFLLTAWVWVCTPVAPRTVLRWLPLVKSTVSRHSSSGISVWNSMVAFPARNSDVLTICFDSFFALRDPRLGGFAHVATVDYHFGDQNQQASPDSQQRPRRHAHAGGALGPVPDGVRDRDDRQGNVEDCGDLVLEFFGLLTDGGGCEVGRVHQMVIEAPGRNFWRRFVHQQLLVVGLFQQPFLGLQNAQKLARLLLFLWWRRAVDAGAVEKIGEIEGSVFVGAGGSRALKDAVSGLESQLAADFLLQRLGQVDEINVRDGR